MISVHCNHDTEYRHPILLSLIKTHPIDIDLHRQITGLHGTDPRHERQGQDRFADDRRSTAFAFPCSYK